MDPDVPEDPPAGAPPEPEAESEPEDTDPDPPDPDPPDAADVPPGTALPDPEPRESVR
ncbi:hypothetical protein [Ornithinimicrobium flavum]|uniref:hypothetical protein n=1 Tax=Ornithinimicrobium flavum TaxID=1288636 RepID=UPI0030845931